MSLKITRKLLKNYGGAVLFAVLVAVLIRVFVIEAYRIPINTVNMMVPTLEAGDTIFVLKWPPSFLEKKLLSRGEVVVFSVESGSAGDSSAQSVALSKHNSIKRVLGLPGDEIVVSHGRVILNGKLLAVVRPDPQNHCGKELLPEGKSHSICWGSFNEFTTDDSVLLSSSLPDFGPEKVPNDSIFVYGDFRGENSLDSLKKRKNWGMVKLSSIQGSALWIWLSIAPRIATDNSDHVKAGQNSSSHLANYPKVRWERMFRRVL